MTEVAEAAVPAVMSEKRRLSMKRVEDWTMEDSRKELMKYCRTEEAPGVPLESPLALCDPLVETVLLERQTYTLEFLSKMGELIERYGKWAVLANEEANKYYTRDDVNALFAPRGRIINLPVDIIPDPDDPEGKGMAKSILQLPTDGSAAADGPVKVKIRTGVDDSADKKKKADAASKGGDSKKGLVAAADDDDDTDSTSSSDSSTPVEPSADAPQIPPPDNSLLLKHLGTLMEEARTLDMSLILVQEWFTLNVPGYTGDDEEALEVVAKLVEEIGETRGVATERYDFYETYLDVRADLESNLKRYPDVQGFREIAVARDHAAWEEVVRSWGLMASAVAALNKTLTENIKYVVQEDEDDVHQVHESTLFM